MKTRITSLLVAIAFLLNMTSAYAYERSCWQGTVPPEIGTSNLDPTFIHFVYLYPLEVNAAYETRVSMNLTVLTTYTGCSFSGVSDWEPTLPHVSGVEARFWSFLTNLVMPGCSGAQYGWQLVRIFNASWTWTWVDPNDPFQVPYTYTTNGLWPSEGIPCPQGVLRGHLSY